MTNEESAEIEGKGIVVPKKTDWQNLTALGCLIACVMWAVFSGIPKGLEKINDMAGMFAREASEQRKDFRDELKVQRSEFREELQAYRLHSETLQKENTAALNSLANAFEGLTNQITREHRNVP